MISYLASVLSGQGEQIPVFFCVRLYSIGPLKLYCTVCDCTVGPLKLYCTVCDCTVGPLKL